MNTTPQALALEIEKHERFLATVEAGLVKLSPYKKRKHKQYIKELTAQLMALTADDSTDELSDDELLAELLD